MKSTHLSVGDFGRQLILTGDLDPIYIAVDALRMDNTTLNRWLLAYWCCYDAGASCFLAEAPSAEEFWMRLGSLAVNDSKCPTGGRWPRGTERRHWRGRNATQSWSHLEGQYRSRPEGMAYYCAHGGIYGQEVMATHTTCAKVMARAKEHRGFGDWIGFKVADMVERLMPHVSVSFEEAEVFLFKAPREGAALAWQEMTGEDVPDEPAGLVNWLTETVTCVQSALADLTAPPRHDRPVGLQEVETVLCKWKSYLGGRYVVGTDIHEIRAHLLPWQPHSPLAQQFLSHMPKEVTA